MDTPQQLCGQVNLSGVMFYSHTSGHLHGNCNFAAHIWNGRFGCNMTRVYVNCFGGSVWTWHLSWHFDTCSSCTSVCLCMKTFITVLLVWCLPCWLAVFKVVKWILSKLNKSLITSKCGSFSDRCHIVNSLVFGVLQRELVIISMQKSCC